MHVILRAWNSNSLLMHMVRFKDAYSNIPIAVKQGARSFINTNKIYRHRAPHRSKW